MELEGQGWGEMGWEVAKIFSLSSIRPPRRERICGMRKPRQLLEGARYHVSARINRKEMLLDPSGIKTMFLEVVKRAKLKYGFKIENFCIMGNHFHFIMQPDEGVSPVSYTHLTLPTNREV